jgi:hypothetical protein
MFIGRAIAAERPIWPASRMFVGLPSSKPRWGRAGASPNLGL